MQPRSGVTLQRLFGKLAAQILGDPQLAVTSIEVDSRRVHTGALFFCLQGEHQDGHAFAAEAGAAGACAIAAMRRVEVGPRIVQVIVPDTLAALSPVAAEFYHHPSSHLTCIGVTGTNGKTTTTFLVEAIARAAKRRYGLTGTLGAWLDGKLLEELPNTTPFSNELQRILAQFRDLGAAGAVMEVSSHALALHRVDDIEFDVAVLTNVTVDHLDFHRNFDEYRAIKRRLFHGSQRVRAKPPQTAVFNLDDAEGRALASELDKRLTYGVNNTDAMLNAEQIELRPDGSRFLVRSLRPVPFVSRLPGPFNVSNAMAALATACALDIDVESMAEGLESVHEIPGRMMALPAGDRAIFIDYAHTPDGLEKVLNAARALTKNKLICVFGCGGNRDATKRPLMGRVASELADEVIVTTDNPRHELPAAIIENIMAGVSKSDRSKVNVIEDRSAAIERAIAQSRPGDVIVIAGKGHETHQIVGDRRLPFSDAHVARGAIAKVLAKC